MTWNQLKDADMTVGYEGGWCLKYVQDAFHTDHPYPTAVGAWNANYGGGNHPGEVPPLGITVAVYFTLGNVPAGHVAIRLSDGWVASSSLAGVHAVPFYYKSLDDLMADYGKYNGGCTYLGWSEFVGTVRVVQLQSDNATDDQIDRAYLDILGRSVYDDPEGLAHYRNYPLDFVREDLTYSAEAHQLIANKQATAAKAAQDAADAQAKAAADAQAAADAKAAEEAQKAADAMAIADEQAKARQDAIDKQAAGAKEAAAQAQQNVSDHQFIQRFKDLITNIIKFFTDLRGN